MPFLSKIKFKPDNKSEGLFLTENEITFKSKQFNEVFKIPKGFRTDLVSTPSGFKFIFPQDDPQLAPAAILHDFLIESGVDEAKAADIFLEAAKEVGPSNIKANAAFGGLKLFGGLFEPSARRNLRDIFKRDNDR